MPELPLATRRRFVASSAASLAAWTLAGCSSHRRPLTSSAPAPGTAGRGSLKDTAARANLLFGFAVDFKLLRTDKAYQALIADQASILVPENGMKWDAMRPAIDRYFFDDADMYVQFGERHHIRLRGHNLCWHEALPPWFGAAVNSANARQVLSDHIRTVCGRYAGRMHSWDVVNEAVEVRDGRPDGLRASPWLRFIGNDYIETAFRQARDADPTALLCYNEYGIEDESREAAEKRSAVLLLLRRLKQRNVPIDAVGIQSHLTARSQSGYGAGLRQFMTSCREMGLEIFLSEIDVNDRNLPQAPDIRDTMVADQYGSYLDLTLADRAVTAVLTWGVSDAGVYFLNTPGQARKDGRPQRPLLYDTRYHAKPAFAAVQQSFARRARSGEAPKSAARPGKPPVPLKIPPL